MNRREFLQSAFYSSLLYGYGGLPNIASNANAAFEPLQNKVLANIFLDGGPDMRHLIVPAYDSNPNSFGNKYWKHRWRAHRLSRTNQNTWQARWNNDYFPITVGTDNWSAGLVDSGGLNDGITFGIWKEAGWLIDMFTQGKVAMVCNAVGGRNRAHDLSALMLNQGNVLSNLNQRDRSGWGGRLARSANGNMISLTYSPTPFCFGPVGDALNYNPNAIDNKDLISIENTRQFGLFAHDLDQEQLYRINSKMARSLSSYYAGLRQEEFDPIYEKFMDHEFKVRQFGELIKERLDSNEPDLIRALYSDRFDRSHSALPGEDEYPLHNINNDADGNSRRVLYNSYFGGQIRNLYDSLASNDLLGTRVVSLRYDNWDSHAEQRQNANLSDLNDPNIIRGIENGFKDIFGGPYGTQSSGMPNALHGGLSALWQNLNQVDKDKLVVTVAGEFGRQIRDNGDAGTDHGTANIMLIISEQVAGGIYGEMFQEDEVDKYDDMSLYTPDIDPRTDLDHFFAKACDWVQPNSGNSVFPRLTNSSLPIEDQPLLEEGVSFDSLF